MLVRSLVGVVDEERRLREEFRRGQEDRYRYAEFINGEIVFQEERVRLVHKEVIDRLADLGRAVVRRTRAGRFHSDGLLVETTRNDYKPDLYYWPREVRETFERGQTVFPPPAFVAEVLSPSTAARDRGVKFEDYAAHGTREYWLIDAEAEAVEAYELDNGAFRLRERLVVADGGVLRSSVVDGLAFPVAALFDDDALAAALADLA